MGPSSKTAQYAPIAASGGPRPAMRGAHPQRGAGLLSRALDRGFVGLAVSPTALVMLLVFGLPLAFSLYLSTEGWSADESLFGGRFAGLANYAALLTDPDFIGSLNLTLGYTAVTVLCELLLGLGVALLLDLDLAGIGFFRTALIVPMMMTPIVAALCWKLLLDPDHGIVDYLLGRNIIWLGQPWLALISVGFASVWQTHRSSRSLRWPACAPCPMSPWRQRRSTVPTLCCAFGT